MTALERLSIEPMQPGDISQVLELEKFFPSPWSEDHIRDELNQQTGFQFVVRRKATGSIIAAIFGRIVSDESEILKISVADYARNKGLGFQLLDFAVNYCSRKGAKNCFLELRNSNVAARHLYEKRGFSKVGTREKYYSEPVEDGILMQLELSIE
jgi:ribosomal-protein-alanine N-acetyltransferase